MTLTGNVVLYVEPTGQLARMAMATASDQNVL